MILMGGTRTAGVTILVACSFAPATALAAEHLIDDFEGAQAPAPWVFSNGPEFPGAAGSLGLDAGHEGSGAQLTYDFSGGGQYVSATIALEPAVPAVAVALWVRNAPGIRVVLRVVDETGQTLQLQPARPIDAWDGSAWYRLVVPVATSSSHWGGADDGVLHGSVHQLAVLASDPMEPGTVGAMGFDEVSWLDELAWTLDPATLLRAPVPANAGSLRERLGANIHFTSDDQALDALEDAAFGWVRMDLQWSWVEQQGSYDFGAFDALVTAAQQRGMRTHFILDYGHPDHQSAEGYPPLTPEQIDAFGSYAQAAAAHFAGQGVQFEVWNEANLAHFWPPAPDVTQYAPLAQEAIARVHAGDPDALVSTTGTAGIDLTFIRDCIALGCADDADAIAVHPYRQGGPETAAEEILLLRELIASEVPSNPPVWNSEWGYSSSWYGNGHEAEPRHRQAVLAVREVLTSWALGLPLAVYYDVRDDGVDPAEKEHNFGLLANDYADKPAMVALRTLSAVAAPRELSAFGIALPGTLHVLELEAAADWTYALWSSTEGRTITVHVPAEAQVIDMLGSPVALEPDGATAPLAVSEDAGPVFVTIAKPPEPDGGTPDAATGGAGGGAGGAGAGAEGAAPASSEEEGDCGCRTPGAQDGPWPGWTAVLAVAALARRARRRSRVGRRA